jgi:hypothetical protein
MLMAKVLKFTPEEIQYAVQLPTSGSPALRMEIKRKLEIQYKIFIAMS